MKESEETLWTIDALGEAVSTALSVGYEGQESGRVREVPDQRTIRYYTTLGLIDRPAAMRGRTALYGERHLLQLVAIKRLQAEGRTLSEVQAELAGLPTRSLRKVARVPESGPEGRRAGDTVEARDPRSTSEVRDGEATPEAGRSRGETGRRARAFWSTMPEAEPANEAKTANEAKRPEPSERLGRDAPLAGLPLGEEVFLLFRPATAVGSEDLEAIERAARPLLDLLHSRGLIERRTKKVEG